MDPEFSLEHVYEGVLVHQERAFQVHVDDTVPLDFVHQVDRTASGDPGAVHERVELPVAGDHVGERPAHRGLVADVQHVVGSFGDVDGGDRGTLVGQALDAGRADARCRAGHHGDGSLESIHAESPLFVRHRSGACA